MPIGFWSSLEDKFEIFGPENDNERASCNELRRKLNTAELSPEI